MFSELTLFKYSSAMAQHAGKRQALVAQNMANVDTPGYRASDLTPFSQAFSSGSEMRSSRSAHLHGFDPANLTAAPEKVRVESQSPNKNAVSVEQEMLRAVEVQRQHSRALAVYRHTMTTLRASLGSR